MRASFEAHASYDLVTSPLRREDSVAALGRRRHPRQLGILMLRIDTHHHMIPPDYRKALRRLGIDEAGGRAVPDWSRVGSLQTMAELGVATAILSVSTPGTTLLPDAADAAALARDLNDYSSDLVASAPDRFGFFATLPLPHVEESVAEVVRSLEASRQTVWCCWPTTMAPTSVRTGRTASGRRWMSGRRWCSSIRPICPARRCPAWRRGPQTSSSTPPAPRTCWCATAFAASTRTSGSS